MEAIKLVFTNRKYFSPAFLFATLNIVIGTWAIYIPAISARLDLEESELGFALFFIALGTLVALPFLPVLAKRLGIGKLSFLAVVLMCVSILGPFLAENYITLCASLFVFGVFNGLLDAGMNTLVNEIEKQENAHFMSISHGFFSLGGMVSAGIGTFLIGVFDSAVLHIATVVGLMIVLNLAFAKNYSSVKTSAHEESSGFKLKNLKPLIGLAIIAFLIFASEGAIVDWSALYLEKVTLADVSLFGMGYTAFNGMMAVGRFFGDGISKRFGSKVILVGGALLGAIGFALVLTGETWVAITGFAIVGTGLSIIVPELLRYAGQLLNVPSAEGVSFVAGVGFSGMLLGPVLLGFLAGAFSLKSSFIALLCATVFAAVLSFSLKRK